ncbi:hypothetical protein BZA77DRAFT_320991 [Pyronema omphalodes]|nr:hypothetical protein BZA77DRAFT_320991 [Pyronema omphalodes]
MQFILVLATLLTAAVAAPNGYCPPLHPQDPTTFLSDTESCQIFYICDHSGPVKFSCPEGTNFSPNTHNCDFPNHAGCTVGQYH